MTWGLCPQTPEVYRFVHERAAGLPCEKERHFCAALPWLGSALRSPLGVAVSSVRAERVYHGLYRFYPHQIKIVLDKGSTLSFTKTLNWENFISLTLYLLLEPFVYKCLMAHKHLSSKHNHILEIMSLIVNRYLLARFLDKEQNKHFQGQKHNHLINSG